MKPNHDPFPKKGANPHDQTGRAASAGVCAKCKTPVPAKVGFRPSSLKCPKCGTPLER